MIDLGAAPLCEYKGYILVKSRGKGACTSRFSCH